MQDKLIKFGSKTLYEVEVTRTFYTSVMVLSEDKIGAVEDAQELASNMYSSDFDHDDIEYDAYVANQEPPEWQIVWTGGPDGKDISWKDLKANQPEAPHQEVPGQESLLS